MSSPAATQRPFVVSLGELLWDLLPAGPQLGGAPANVACHAAALGARAAVVSCVGDDPLGREAVSILQSRGLDTEAIEVLPGVPTGTVHVEVDASGHPRFDIVRDVAWDRLTAGEAGSAARVRAATADAVCFGTLAQRTPGARAAVHALLEEVRADALRVFDINLRPPFHAPDVIEESLRGANVLKLNEDELPVLSAQLGWAGSVEGQVRAVAGRFGLRAVALTLGARGAGLLMEDTWTTEPGRVVEVRDAVGAGDAFTAVLIMGLLLKWDARAILGRATDVAAYVCTQPGATPMLPSGWRMA